jgi:hypothetical protein
VLLGDRALLLGDVGNWVGGQAGLSRAPTALRCSR